jgi:hypothetical protein
MKFESLVTGSLQNIGIRFNLVGLLPTTVLTLFILLLVWSGAPGQMPDMYRIIQNAEALQVGEVLYLVLIILVAALVLQPLQLGIVRLLEGYWGNSWFTVGITRFGISMHRRRRDKLEAETMLTKKAEDIDAAEKAHLEDVALKLSETYPSGERVLPTGLGNALRAAEENAGGRYGLDTVVVWPSIYPLLSQELTSTLIDSRDQLDMAARFCVTFIIIALVSVGVLWSYGWWLFVPVGALVLAWISYRSAISAAISYGYGLKAAFDLHRFDLLKALHLALPINLEKELKANEELCDFLRQGIPAEFKYEHGTQEASKDKK